MKQILFKMKGDTTVVAQKYFWNEKILEWYKYFWPICVLLRRICGRNMRKMYISNVYKGLECLDEGMKEQHPENKFTACFKKVFLN